MKHISTVESERKLKEKEVQLIRQLDEEEHLRSEQGELLNKLEQKEVLNREKIEQGMQDSELDKQTGEAVVGISPTVNKEFRIKEKNEAEEQRWEKKKIKRQLEKHVENKG